MLEIFSDLLTQVYLFLINTRPEWLMMAAGMIVGICFIMSEMSERIWPSIIKDIKDIRALHPFREQARLIRELFRK